MRGVEERGPLATDVRKSHGGPVALLAVGRFSYTLFSRSENRPALPVAVPGSHHLLVGSLDDANFRWRPYRARMLDEAHATGAQLVRALVYWNVVAPGRRPTAGQPPFVVPRLYELVASAAARHMQILFTMWGTPTWANGGLGPNHPPSGPRDLRVFARALAARYPQVRRYAVWNEPNDEQFLAPQFEASGHSLAPCLYGRLYSAAYAGIEEGNPHALVAIGETSSHGRDAPSRGCIQDSDSPAREVHAIDG